MTFSELNFLGILVAFFVSFISGAIWFGPKTFYPIWMKERGIASGQLNSNQNKPVLLFGGTILGVLIQTLTLGLIINSLQQAGAEIGISNQKLHARGPMGLEAMTTTTWIVTGTGQIRS